MKVIFRQDGFPSGEPNFLIRFVENERVEKVVRIVLIVFMAVVFVSVVSVVFSLMVGSQGWDKILDWLEWFFR
ncbi:MAG: hypothetical protein NTX98_00945 [Candidatus Doudnabacteria bacterium]|nr:hypothetical protein [Candidatus Doudnabacteria bacterium]